MNLENYLKQIKNIKENKDIYILSRSITKKYIDDEGYINVSNFLFEDLKILIILIIKKYYNNDKNIIDLINNYKFNENQKYVFYKDFYENLSYKISSLETTDINYKIIAKIIFEIYLHGTTFNNLSDYLKFNINLDYKNIDPLKINILENYICNNINSFKNKFTINSYKLLSLGHLLKLYLNSEKSIIIENINLTYARIALELTKNNNLDVIEIFNDIFNHYYAPSTPVYYNSLFKKNMLTSCFILNVEDNIDSIGSFYKKITNILKYNSGIGVILSKIRSKNRPVMDSLTLSKGIFYYIDILAIFSQQFKNDLKKRSTNINITLSIDHPDVIKFLDLKLNINSKEGIPYHNLFQTISIPDEFMYRYLTNKSWYLISPDQHINGQYLYNAIGNEYTELYNLMINDNKIEKIEINPEILMTKLINARIQTGGPFIFFKDTVNKTSPYKEIIHGTNLCTEILQYCNDNETACCNIISINLKEFVKNKIFNFDLYKQKIKNIIYILNNIIDNVYFSDKTCENANKTQRPMAIGIQGLANAINKMNLSYLEGKEFYRKIMEMLYYESLKISCEIAKNKKKSIIIKKYEFHFNKFYNNQVEKYNKLKKLGLEKIANKMDNKIFLPKYIDNWKNLEKDINTYGLYNSLFIGLMPTSLSSGVYNNSESFEPYSYNIYKKTYNNYDILFYNDFLINELLENNTNYNSKNILSKLLEVDGDINKLNISQKLKEYLKKKYITLHEIDIDKYLDFNLAIDAFVDQGISYNISILNNNHKLMIKNLIDLWLNGKKTIYYYRTTLNINPLVFNNKISEQIQNTFCSNQCDTCII